MAAFGFGIYLLVESGTDIWSNIGWSWGMVLSGIVLGIGILTIAVAIFGIVGSSKRNKCCLCMY